jgi:hypothetical protein
MPLCTCVMTAASASVTQAQNPYPVGQQLRLVRRASVRVKGGVAAFMTGADGNPWRPGRPAA